MDEEALRGLFGSIVRHESGGNPLAESPKGATGLMQIMPKTAMDPGYGLPSIFELSRQYGFSPMAEDEETAKELLRDPELNTAFGEQYMRRMLQRFGGDLDRSLVAYNWGVGNAAKWSGRLEDLPKETRDYLRKVKSTMEGLAPVSTPVPQPRPEGLGSLSSTDEARMFLMERLLGGDQRGIAQVARMAAARGMA